jgi:RND family efflux transporter MFP subunit
MTAKTTFFSVLACSLILTTACGETPQAANPTASASPETPPAKVDGAVRETELAVLHLTPEAESRLGIEVVPVEQRRMATYRTLSGEVTLPPGQSQTITAPVAGMLTAVGAPPQVGASVQRGQALYRLVPIERESRGRDLRADAERELETAQARVQAARLRVARAEQLLRDGAGSQRNLEEAQLELSQAEAAEKAAREQLSYLSQTPFDNPQGLTIEAPDAGMVVKTHISAGQVVPAGTAVMDIARVNPVWIRVPVYVGELREFSASGSVLIHPIGSTPGTGGRAARRVTGIPSANAAAATADLFYEIDNAGLAFRPGEKVGVSFASGGDQALVVPWSAVIHDINGGTWVYEQTAPQTYSRQRIEVLYVRDEIAALRRGPAVGKSVVKTGAAELFGTEFGVGK